MRNTRDCCKRFIAFPFDSPRKFGRWKLDRKFSLDVKKRSTLLALLAEIITTSRLDNVVFDSAWQTSRTNLILRDSQSSRSPQSKLFVWTSTPVSSCARRSGVALCSSWAIRKIIPSPPHRSHEVSWYSRAFSALGCCGRIARRKIT